MSSRPGPRRALGAAVVTLSLLGCASALLDRPYREELTVPHRNETCREVDVGVDQGYEGRHLLRMRRGVVDDQQATRAEHALQVWPPPRILGPFGIEEYEVEGTITRAFQHTTRIVVNQRDEGSEAGPSEVRRGQPHLVLGELYGGHRPSNGLRGTGQPQCRVPIGRADLEHAPSQGRGDQHGQEGARVSRDVEHPTRTLGR